jgi:hypothetical protein
MTITKQSNYLLPEDLTEEIKKLVPKREQSKFVAEAIRRELKRLKFQKALQTSFGLWIDERHPELQQGTESYVREMRKSTRMRRV